MSRLSETDAILRESAGAVTFTVRDYLMKHATHYRDCLAHENSQSKLLIFREHAKVPSILQKPVTLIFYTPRAFLRHRHHASNAVVMPL
jgi:hypothetical protein